MMFSCCHKLIKKQTICGAVYQKFFWMLTKEPRILIKKNFMKLGRTKERRKNKKERKGEKNQVIACATGRELEKEKKSFCTLGSAPHQWGNQLRQRKNFGVLEEKVAIGVKQLKLKRSSTNCNCHCPALSNHNLGQTGPRNWNSHFGNQPQTEIWDGYLGKN